MRAAIWENPVYVKEMRTWRRMKAARRLRLGYLGVMLFLALGAIMLPMHEHHPDALPTIFAWVCYVELLCALVLPGLFAAAAVTAEREVQTLDGILVTGLRPQEIVTGKTLAAAARMGLLVLYSLPPLVLAMALQQLRFGTRGPMITVGQLIASQLVIGAIVTLYSAIGVFASSLFNRTVYAMGAVLAMVVFLNVGIPALPAIWEAPLLFGDARPMAAAVRAVMRYFIGAAVLAFGVFAATVLVIHSLRPGFARSRAWYIALYGGIVILMTAGLHLPPLARRVEGSVDYYGYHRDPYVLRNLTPAAAMHSVLVSTLDDGSHPFIPRATSVWSLRMGDVPVWPLLLAAYLPLTAAVVFLARLRFARMQWRG